MKAIYTVNDIKRILQPVFKKHNIKKAVLFGSYAKGEADAKSDIDIMVDSNLRGLAFYGLLEDVVNAVGLQVDLLDRRRWICWTGGKLYRRQKFRLKLKTPEL